MRARFAHDKQAAEIYKGLPRVRQRLVREAAGELALKYAIDPELISLFGKAGRRSVQLVVAYTAPSGIDLGRRKSGNAAERSWQGIFPEDMLDMKKRQEAPVPKRFSLQATGLAYDTRLGMTRDVYRSMVARMRRQHSPLPDSPPADLTDVHAWTWTLLTGESRFRDCAPVVCTDLDRAVYSTSTAFDNGLPNVRFRPAVILV